jgi:orotate phosphoribosyltransferase
VKPVGTVKIKLAQNLTEVPAFKIGKFWAVNSSGDGSPYYNVTHRNTGEQLLSYIGLRRAQKLTGVLDVLMPTALVSELEQRWRSFPKAVQQALLEK